MKIRKILIASILIAMLLPVETKAADIPELSAKSAVLVDADSGRVLMEYNADEPRLIASTTKIMTALVVLERADLDETVTVAPEWAAVEGSSMYLAAGQELTVRDLLYGLMLASGNDAAVALACVTAGSVEAFAELMNERAASLGCENTHFENPSGLDGERHYSSARDLARIAGEAIRNEEFRRIVSTWAVTIGELTYTNHNRLLRECEGVFGVKTGYTEAAGRTLVSCCERNGVTLICVTLSDPDDWHDHAALYDWAYGAYAVDDAASAVGVLAVPVIGGTEEMVHVSPKNSFSVLRGRDESVSVSVKLPAFVYAPVERGGTAGDADIYVSGAKIGSLELLYDTDVDRTAQETPTFWEWIGAALQLGERKIYTLT